jgi:hypothetical protein
MKLWRLHLDLDKAENFSEPKINALIPLSHNFGHGSFPHIIQLPLLNTVDLILSPHHTGVSLTWQHSSCSLNIDGPLAEELMYLSGSNTVWTQPARFCNIYQRAERRRISDLWKESNYAWGNIIPKNNIAYVHDVKTPITVATVRRWCWVCKSRCRVHSAKELHIISRHANRSLNLPLALARSHSWLQFSSSSMTKVSVLSYILWRIWCFLRNDFQNTRHIRCEYCYATASGTKVNTRSITLTVGNS